ncbi:MAG: hypothetical protein KatS3mg026_0558 [Bacteroidia bacterium]|nr:MAG: hypothetical protein KatS3mg026_0558 [Bacteroidia bacterium]
MEFISPAALTTASCGARSTPAEALTAQMALTGVRVEMEEGDGGEEMEMIESVRVSHLQALLMEEVLAGLAEEGALGELVDSFQICSLAKGVETAEMAEMVEPGEQGAMVYTIHLVDPGIQAVREL